MKQPLRAGDVLLTSEAPTGEVAYLDSDTDWCLGQRVFGLRGKPGLLLGRYLYYLLRGGDVRHQLLARGTGTTVSGIRQSELVKIELHLPSIDEQRETAATLGALDGKIESNRRVHALMWELIGAEYAQLATDGHLVTLGDLLALEYGRALPAGARVHGDVPVYGSNGVTGWHASALLDGPAIIVGRKGSIGEVHWSHVDCYPIDTTYFVRPVKAYPLLAAFFALRTAGLREMNSDSAVPGLNRQAALNVEVVAPALPRAVAWARDREVFTEELRHLERETESLTALRDALLPQLLSGRIRVPEAAEAVA